MKNTGTKIKLVWQRITELGICGVLLLLTYATLGWHAMLRFLSTLGITILVTPMALACLAVDKIRRRRNAKCK